MTDPEFDEWTADTFRKFPAIAAWVRTAGQSAELLADWRDALATAGLADLLEVNRRMLAGDDDGPGKFASDWQTLPSHVRRLAAAVRLRREIAEPYDREHVELAGPRYRCKHCQDTGRRFVAHYAMVAAWFAGDVTACKYRVAVVLCDCQKSDPVRTRQGQDAKREGIATFKDGLHFPITDPGRWSLGPTAEMFEEFAAWCEASYKAWANRKRHHEFDDFNRQEAFV